MLVLVRGGPERLGELVRCMVRLAPDANVLLRADEVASLPPGSTAVLCLRREDFDWLNVGRPSLLGHRIVLFGDAETALTMERRAVDFCDWISHRIDAPPGPPAFAVRALRNAVCHRSPAVVWRDGDVDAVFAEALPGQRLERVSAAQPYANLVDALRPAPREWIVITNLERSFQVRRFWWAMAEARRYGRVVFSAPGIEMEDVAAVDGAPVPVEEAARRLRMAGVEHGGRLAALLDLQPTAIDRAEMMAREGASDRQIESRLAELAQVTLPSRNGRSRALPPWPERVEQAVAASDLEVAAHWASSWREEERGSARATAALAHVRTKQGKLDGVDALLKTATELAGPCPDPETAFELRRAQAFLHQEEWQPEEALQALGEAIGLLGKIRRPAHVRDELYLQRVRVLVDMGRLKDAERTLREWSKQARSMADEGAARAAALAIVELAWRNAEGAISTLRTALRKVDGDEQPGRDTLVEILARALNDGFQFEDAESLTREAVQELERRGQDSAALRREHARALTGLGRYTEAERELRQVLAGSPRRADATVTRHELARCLTRQGRMEEAEAILDETITEVRKSSFAERAIYSAALFEKAYLCYYRGDEKQASAILKEVLHEEERTLGKDHPTLVRTLNSLADSLLRSDGPVAALPYLRRAQRIAEASGNDVGLALVLRSIARAQTMQQFPQAAHTARRALEVWSRSGSEIPPALRVDLEALAAGRLISWEAGWPHRPPTT